MKKAKDKETLNVRAIKRTSNIGKKILLARAAGTDYGHISNILLFPGGEEKVKQMLRKNNTDTDENLTVLKCIMESIKDFQCRNKRFQLAQ